MPQLTILFSKFPLLEIVPESWFLPIKECQGHSGTCYKFHLYIFHSQTVRFHRPRLRSWESVISMRDLGILEKNTRNVYHIHKLTEILSPVFLSSPCSVLSVHWIPQNEVEEMPTMKSGQNNQCNCTILICYSCWHSFKVLAKTMLHSELRTSLDLWQSPQTSRG